MKKLLVLALCATHLCFAAANSESGPVMLPLNCSELLPDNGIYLGFFENVAKGAVTRDKEFSKRLFRILALREKIAEAVDKTRETNPIDIVIRRTMCFYREQKDPTRAIPFDDPEFLGFLKSSLKDLETKIDDAVFEVELDKHQRNEYERKLQKSELMSDALKQQADNEAQRAFDKLSRAAKRKVSQP